MSFILLGILNSQVEAAGGGAYELIESNILSSSASSVTFSSIPQDYKHLQIRAVARTNFASTGADGLRAYMNGDTGTSYRRHFLVGTGSAVASSDAFGSTVPNIGVTTSASSVANAFAANVIDILDYANTSKNTTVRNFSGAANDSTMVRLDSNLYINTAAISSILLNMQNGTNFIAGSRFSLYGIRG